MMGLGIQELLLIGVLLVILFAGPKMLPKIGRAAGQTIREMGTTGAEFKKAMRGTEEAITEAKDIASTVTKEVGEVTGEAIADAKHAMSQVRGR